MQPLPFFLHQPGLVLLAGLAGIGLSGIPLAEANTNANFSANIVNNTCELSVENGGDIFLPVVMRTWFYNDNGSDRYTPTDDAGGTPFTLHVDNCGEGDGLEQLTFSFSPKSGFWSNQNQVFKNDATADAAENVGVVIFSAATHTNVLSSDGSSEVVYDISGQSGTQYLTDYPFYVRYQNVGAVGAGTVTSNVLVDVRYE